MGFLPSDTKATTRDQINRRRQVAEALLAQSTGRVARDPWEGIAQVGQAIAGKVKERRVDAEEADAAKAASGRYAEIVAALVGQPMAQQAPAFAPAAIERDLDAVAPASLADRVEMRESGGDPSAVSPKGAGGLMQIMPATARDPGYGVPTIYDMAAQAGVAPPPGPEAGDQAMTAWLSDPANAAVNRQFGEAYLGAMGQQFGGDERLQLAAYNAGPGAVEQYGGVPPFAETQAYVNALAGQGGATPAVVQVAQAMPQQAGGLDPRLLQLAGDEFLNDGQRAVVNALIQNQMRAMQPMTPAERLQAEKLGLEVEQLRGGQQMTPYQREQIAIEREKMALEGANAGRGEFGLSPVWGTDAQGQPALIQLGRDGQPVQPQLPDGFQIARDPIRIDAGTKTILLDPQTRQVIGEVAKDVAGEAAQSAAGAAEGARIGSAPKTVTQADTMLADIDAVMGDPQLGNALGWSSYVPFDIPGYNTQPRSRIEKLQGQAFLQAFESLKGGGAITEIEGKKAEQAIARLRTSQTEDEFKAALGELRGIVIAAKDRASARLPGGIPEAPAPAASPTAPKVLRYNPETGELE